MKLTDESKDIWLWLFHAGGAWTAYEVARQLRRDADEVFWRLSGMARRGLIVKLAPAIGSRRLRYAVTGTCLVPNGMCVAEVQPVDHHETEPACGELDAPLRSLAFHTPAVAVAPYAEARA